MSTKTIDTRVVELEFANKKFEDNVKTSLSSLEKLENGLNLDNAAKGFNAATTIITGALLNLGAKITDTATAMAKSLTLDPLISGLSSYEKQIGSVQVIMNATNKSIDEVESTMSRLTWFADETSYSMDQMTSAVSRFVSNNIDLEKSATAIQGIANMAALAGVSGQNAAIAFNNISDAIAKGGLTAIDYKSLEIAGITTTKFKETAIETAIAMGTLGKSGEILSGRMKGTIVTINNFKETLSEQESGLWFNNEVILAQADAFGAYSTAVSNVQEELSGLNVNAIIDLMGSSTEEFKKNLDNLGYSSEKVQDLMDIVGSSITELGKKAFLAAQESKTLTDSINYTRDALASSWATSWKLIFGNYEEAKIVFTGLSDLLYNVVVSSNDARNEMLSVWKDDGGRAAFLESLDAIVHIVSRIAEPIQTAFRNIFPSLTGKQLADFTKKFRDLLLNFKMSDKTAENLRKTFSGLFSIFDIGVTGIKSIITFFGRLIKLFSPIGGGILSITGGFGDLLTKIRDVIKDGNLLDSFFNAIIFALEKLGSLASPVTSKIFEGFNLLGNSLSSLGSKIKEIFSGDIGSGDFLNRINSTFDAIKKSSSSFIEVFSNMFSTAITRIKEFSGVELNAGFIETLKGFFNSLPTLEAIITQVKLFFFNFGDTLAKASPIFKKAWNVIGPILEDLFSQIKNTLGSLDLQKALQIVNSILSIGLVKTLMNLTGAFGEFTSSTKKVANSIAGVFTELKKTVSSFNWITKGKAIKEFAIAVGILVASLIALSFIDIGKLSISLGFLTAVVAELLIAMKLMSTMSIESGPKLLSLAVFLVGLGSAVLILATAMSKLAALNSEQITRGLGAITVLLLELAVVSKILGNGKAVSSMGVSFIMLSAALLALSKVITMYNDMDVTTMATGLAKMAAVFIVLSVAMAGLGNTSNEFLGLTSGTKSSLLNMAAGLLILTAALTALSATIKLYSILSFDTLAKGLISMAATIVTLGLALKVLNTDLKSAAGLALLSVTLSALAIPFLLISKVPFGDVVKGIIAIAGAIAALTIGANGLDKTKADNMVKLATAMAAFAGGFKILSVAMKGIDTATFVKTLIATGAALALLYTLSKAGENSKGAVTSATAMLLVFTGLAAVFHLLATFSDPDRILMVATSLTLIITALSGMILTMSNVKPSVVAKASAALLLLELALIPIIGILAGLSLLPIDPTDLIPIAMSLGVLMLALSTTAYLVGGIDAKKVASAFTAMLLLEVLLAGAAVVLGVLSHFVDDPVKLIPTATALGILMNTLASAALILSFAHGDFASGVSAIGVATILIAAAAVIIAILGSFADKKDQFEAGAEMLGIIGVAIGNFIGGLLGGIVGGALAGVTSGLPQVGVHLSDFMANAEGFIEGSKNINASSTQGLKHLVEALLLITASSLIDSLTSWLTGGFDAEKLAEQFGAMGAAINAFYTETKYITADSIKETAEATKILFEALSKAPNSGGLLGKIMGNNDADVVGAQLESFGNALVKFDNATSTLNHDSVKEAGITMERLFSSMSKAPNTGGLLGDIMGNNDLDVVGDQLTGFAKSLTSFSTSSQNFNNESMREAGETMRILFQSMSKAPNTGGILEDLIGGNNVDTVGIQLQKFGSSLLTFGLSASYLPNEAIVSASETMKSLFSSMSQAPSSGGFLDFMFGGNDVDKIGEQLKVLGSGLFLFGSYTSGMNHENVVKTTETMSILFEALANAPARGGWLSSALNDSTGTSLKNTLVSVGEGLSAFSISTENVTASRIKDSAEAFGFFVAALANATISDYASIYQFGPQIVKLGESMKTYADFMDQQTVDRITNSTVAIELLSEVMDALKNVDISSQTVNLADKIISMLSDSLKSSSQTKDTQIKMEAFAETLFGYIVNAFSSTRLLEILNSSFDPSIFIPSGEQIVKGISSGMKNFIDIEKSSASLIRAIDGTFAEAFPKLTITAGKNVDAGLIVGMKNNQKDVSKTAKDLATYGIIDPIRDTLGIHSPGKEQQDDGENVDAGLIVGMKNKLTDVKNTAMNVATDGIIEPIGNIIDEFKMSDGTPITRLFSTSMDDMVSEVTASVDSTSAGEKLVNTTAHGIRSTTSAEDAAKSKAQAITEAFSSELSKIGNILNTISLEFSLFEKSLGFVASDDTYASAAQEATINQAKLETLTKQLIQQEDKLVIAQQIYDKTLSEFGTDSEYTAEAQNNLLQAQVDTANLVYEIDSLRYTIEKNRADALASGLETERQYKEALLENLEIFRDSLSKGAVSFKQVQDQTAKDVGYDPEWRAKLEGDINEAVVATLSTVQTVYTQNVVNRLGELTGNYELVGASFVDAMSSGLIDEAPVAKAASDLVGTESLQQMLDKIPGWDNAGVQSVAGFVRGMLDNIDLAIRAGGEIAQAALTAAIRILILGSPSKAFDKIGMYSVLGFVRGITNNTSKAAKASADMAQESLDVFAEAMSAARDIVIGDENYNPVIRPVMDMSEIKEGVGMITSLFDTTTKLSTSVKLASTIASSKRAQQEQNQNGSENVVNNNFNLTQNNTSPKALSTSEIFRQTKNQFSTLRGLVKA